MYFPYLRGRQFELIGIRELVENNCISEHVIPIIEPVRASTTLLKTLSVCNKNGQPVAFIINPRVGTFVKEFELFDKQEELINEIKNPNIIKACIVSSDIQKRLDKLSLFSTTIDKSLFIFDKRDYIDDYLKAIGDNKALYNLIPDERDFRRLIRDNRVILSNPFQTEERNADYSDQPELFTEDHLFYDEDGYKGFADYSIVGDKFSDAGFAPYCVVIHIIYFDDKLRLMIRHFSSISNIDAKDPAKKFSEALDKLINWRKTFNINSYALSKFDELYDQASYPGLGTIKKLSIMHHIELVNKFLNRKSDANL